MMLGLHCRSCAGEPSLGTAESPTLRIQASASEQARERVYVVYKL